MSIDAPQRKVTLDLQQQIELMQQHLDALQMDDESEIREREQQERQIPDKYEHHHDPHHIEFRLLPDPITERSQKWKRFIPILYWLPRYEWREWFGLDLIAAITDIITIVPHSMGYALVAGLQPISGLYSALMGQCLYGPFGTSGQLIVAPVAIVSIMTQETLNTFFDDNDDNDNNIDIIQQKSAYGSALAFQCGVIMLLFGIFRAGILANMLAQPVIVGFTLSAAILISINELIFICQVDLNGDEVIEKIISFQGEIRNKQYDINSILLATCCMVFLLIISYWSKTQRIPCSKYSKFIPSALILVTIATFVSWYYGTSTGFDVVGVLPSGLPKFVNFFNYLNDGDFWHLWVSSILISVLSFVESVSISRKFADKKGYSIDASQELIALGIVNLIGCWFGIYPISGVISLASVVEASGATTPLYGMIAGVGLIICCLFWLFLFQWLPKPVLGAIVLIGALGLIDLKNIYKIWKINKKDFIVMLITILVTLFLGIDIGVALGVVASILLFIQKSAKPYYSVLGRIDFGGNNGNKHNVKKLAIYRNIKYYKSTIKRDDMLMIRWDAPIFFANINSFKSRIKKQIGRYLKENHYPKHWCLCFDFSGVNDIDFSGIIMLEQFFIQLNEKENGMTLILCKLKTQVLNALNKSGIIGNVISKEQILWELHEAEEWWDKNKNINNNIDDNIDGIQGFNAIKHNDNDNNIDTKI